MYKRQVLIINFTNSFSKITAIDFLDKIVVPYFNPECIIVGYDHHFGHNREGGPEFLNEYCKRNTIDIEVVEPISDDGHNISSTRIRELINDGFVRRANFELGSVYGFNAKVMGDLNV